MRPPTANPPWRFGVGGTSESDRWIPALFDRARNVPRLSVHLLGARLHQTEGLILNAQKRVFGKPMSTALMS
jgi:hypothetical protein